MVVVPPKKRPASARPLEKLTTHVISHRQESECDKGFRNQLCGAHEEPLRQLTRAPFITPTPKFSDSKTRVVMLPKPKANPFPWQRARCWAG